MPPLFTSAPAKIQRAASYSAAPLKTGSRNFLQKVFAKGLLEIYQWLGGYSNFAGKDLEKLIKRNDISFKKLLLYIQSGGLSFHELLHVQSINEIKKDDRKTLLRKVIKFDMENFNLNQYIFPELSDIIPLKYFTKSTEKKLLTDFPLLPKNEAEYSEFIENLVESLKYKSSKLPEEKIEIFNKSLAGLKDNLINLSDEEFTKTEAMDFEGVNTILEYIPELEGTIGRKQHGAHDFDVFKHSLKVLKKIGEDEKFKDLNESDKKIMMMAALLHDITKKEGVIDERHPLESSFDAFFISKRFNLTKCEETKLYKLIKNHEWLKYVNISQKTEEIIAWRIFPGSS